MTGPPVALNRVRVQVRACLQPLDARLQAGGEGHQQNLVSPQLGRRAIPQLLLAAKSLRPLQDLAADLVRQLQF